jgi:Ca2+-binding EF-hand superfamily protein
VRLSFDEYKAGRRTLLLSADRDGDGRISPAEWLAGETTIRRKLATAGFPDRDIDLGTGGFARMDANHNGYVDSEELDAYIRKRFESLDVNHDGFLTRKEFEAGLKAGGRY